MSSNTLNAAIIGCGDYVQRWESSPISQSTRFKVKYLFDVKQEQAKKLATKIPADIADSENQIFSDPDIDIVCLFVPPWVRKPLVEKAVKAGKHIITTKPLAPSAQECRDIQTMVGDNIRMAVFYGRTGNAVAETCRQIFESDEIGKLALYKQDWIHHYPTWNDWATDPDKNGGPFMDAMIHNMNLAKHLMGRPVTGVQFFSDTHAHPELKCRDTEFMKLDFEDNGSAHLFITWAADLPVYDPHGNDREHIDLFYMVTDKGWYVTFGEENGAPVINAQKEDQTKSWPVKELTDTPYDAFVDCVVNDASLRPDMISLDMAVSDITLLQEKMF